MSFLLTILGCVISSMVLGYFWYSKWLFGHDWMKLVGIFEHEMKKEGVGANYLITMAAALLEALVLSVVFSFVQVGGIIESLKISFLMWSGFIATTQLTNALFAQKPLKLFLIDAGYHLVAIFAMGIILTIW